MNKRLCRFCKNVCLILLYFSIPLLLGGCTDDMSRKEIDEIDLILVMGIDYSEGEYSLSALYDSGGGAQGGSESSEGGGSEGSEMVAEGKGKTAYEALEDLKLKNKKTITLAQTSSYLLGEGAAKQGLTQSIDFLSRDETIKMEALIYIIKEMSASDFIKKGIKNKQTIHEDLEAMEVKQKELITRNDNTMVNVLNDMRQNYSCVLIPYLIADKSGYLIEGYTVFDGMVYKDYLDHETSDGVNFIKNIMRSYPIYLTDQVGLSVSYTKTKLKARVDNDRIIVTIKLSFDSMIKEVLTDKDIFNLTEMNNLTKAQNEYIKAILEKPVKYSTDKGLDIFNLARLVENQNYKEWDEIKKNWTKEISKIQYEYKVESRISKSFILGGKE